MKKLSAEALTQVGSLISTTQTLLEKVRRQREVYEHSSFSVFPDTLDKTKAAAVLNGIQDLEVFEVDEDISDETIEAILNQPKKDLLIDQLKAVTAISIFPQSLRILSDLVDWRDRTSFLTLEIVGDSDSRIVFDFKQYIGDKRTLTNSSNWPLDISFREGCFKLPFSMSEERVKDWMMSKIAILVQIWISTAIHKTGFAGVGDLSQTHEVVAESSFSLNDVFRASKVSSLSRCNLYYTTKYLRRKQAFRKLKLDPRKIENQDRVFGEIFLALHLELDETPQAYPSGSTQNFFIPEVSGNQQSSIKSNQFEKIGYIYMAVAFLSYESFCLPESCLGWSDRFRESPTHLVFQIFVAERK